MNDETFNKSAAKKLIEHSMANYNWLQVEESFPEFAEYCKAKNEIVVEIASNTFPKVGDLLTEAASKTVGRHTAFRHPPHFSGDSYHAHCNLPGGYELSYNITGTRRHDNKFPAQIPQDAKLAIAQVLKINPGILEAFWVKGDNERILLLQQRLDS